METVSDLVSSIVSFFVILLPVLYLLRSRSNRRREGQQEERRPRKDPSIFQRLKEVQQLSDEDIFIPPEEEAGETASPEPEQAAPSREKSGSEADEYTSNDYQYGSSQDWSAISSVAQDRFRAKPSPLERFETYPIEQRAILLSEVLGPPKALQDNRHTLHE